MPQRTAPTTVEILLLTLSLAACGDTTATDTSTSTTRTSDAATRTASDGTPETDSPSPEPAPSGEDDSPEHPADVAAVPDADPESLHVLVNALNPLDPLDHRPDDLVDVTVPITKPRILLREEAAEALAELFAAAGDEGLELTLTSGYRGFDSQQQIYDTRAAQYGLESADAYVARPGHSEHQTGLAADVLAANHPTCGVLDCFGETPHGEWTAQNAPDYGFIVRYPEGAQDITGYAPESWHLRYLGVPTAQALADSGLTLEEFWDEPPAPGYP